VVIAIDGPGGVGKSTVARRVAAALNAPYLDTGATYRAATLAALRAGADPKDADAVLAALGAATIAYEDETIFLDGADVSAAVRSPEVTAAVSTVSAIQELRRRVVEWQRGWVADHHDRAVVEGRDIGTVVFPDAPLKIFLTASPEVRAARRAGDHEAQGRHVTDIAAELNRRDHLDSTREASPLQPADDAVVIDTDALGLEEVVATVLDLVSARD
jgi:cytidylate kinase